MCRDSDEKSFRNFAEFNTAYGVVQRKPSGAMAPAITANGNHRRSGFQLLETSHGAAQGTAAIRIPEYFAPAVQPAKRPAKGNNQRLLVVTATTVVSTHERITKVSSASSLR
jgi:hypothetical protein